MTLIQLVINGGFLSGLVLLGAWLESINGIDGWVDRCLTPVPMCVGGMFFEAVWPFA